MLGLGLHSAKSSLASAKKSYLPAENTVAWYNEQSISSFSVYQYPDTILDMSGNGYHLEQPDATKRPQVYPVSVLKGLLFTNDTLFESNHPVLRGNTNFTIMYAGGNFQQYHTAIYIGDDDVPDNTSSFRLGKTSSAPHRLRGIVGDNANGAHDTNIPFRFNGFKDIVYAYKNGTDSSDIHLGMDNGAVITDEQFSISGLDLSFGDGIGIGTNNPDDPSLTGTGSGWYIYEILIYDRMLTEDEFESTRKYLRKKWNV